MTSLAIKLHTSVLWFPLSGRESFQDVCIPICRLAKTTTGDNRKGGLEINILQSLIKTATQPAHPLHAGEVFVVWTLYVGVAESRVICQLLANHTDDPDLKEMIEHFIADLEEPIVEKLKHLLAHEGIGIPPATGDKPRANEGQIPPGAKFTDAEIANLLAVKLEGMLNTCHLGIAQAVREDVGAMLVTVYQHLYTQGFTLKKTMQQRGWFRQPPMFQFSPEAPH